MVILILRGKIRRGEGYPWAYGARFSSEHLPKGGRLHGECPNEKGGENKTQVSLNGREKQSYFAVSSYSGSTRHYEGRPWVLSPNLRVKLYSKG